jgi:hypothetical protein
LIALLSFIAHAQVVAVTQVDGSIDVSNTQLSFEQAMRMAADTHPSIAQRLSEQGASEYGATGARWQRWPGLSVSSSRGPLGSTLTELQLEQPLWSGGAHHRQH